MEGHIHSIESMGLVDGPGIRSVVFFQGCRLRCAFCHKPDTWAGQGGETVTPEALVARLKRFRPYFEPSGGGVTFSGGEPLLQPEFLLECLRLCREAGIHTCLDTAGVGWGDYDAILDATDLILFDVKHWDRAAYLALTGQEMDAAQWFLSAAREHGVPLWVRHVMVPGRTDSEAAMAALRAYVDTLPRVRRVELLPYHLLGVNKYETLGIPYPLAGVPAMDPDRCKALENQYFGDLNRHT